MKELVINLILLLPSNALFFYFLFFLLYLVFVILVMSLFIVSLPELHSLANSNTVISVLFLIKLTTLTCLSFKGSFNFPLNQGNGKSILRNIYFGRYYLIFITNGMDAFNSCAIFFYYSNSIHRLHRFH